ncbi:MAG: endopeptidase La [Candidatus Eisenbacteria bacterium]
MIGAGKVPIPGELPLLALHRDVLFPGGRTSIDLVDPEEIALADYSLGGHRFVALFPRFGDGELSSRGTAAIIEQMRREKEGGIRLTLLGVTRVDRVSETREEEGFPVAEVRPAPAGRGHELRIEALRRSVLDAFDAAAREGMVEGEGAPDEARRAGTAGRAADLVAAGLRLSPEEKILLLEQEDVERRLETLGKILDRERSIAVLENRLREEVGTALGKRERDRYLRQKLHAIRAELGEEDERETQVRELDRRLAEARLPVPVENACRDEITRLGRLPVQSGEFAIARTHIDWILGLPWTVSSEDTIDLERARKILDRNHHGLGRTKERVLEFLAVRKLKSDSPSPLLCFVGPPGTGKTTLGLSIADALERRVAHLSLGGVMDESEIRGHRRTYQGALPGRVLQEIRRVGVRNPLFMLDEIDKIGSDFRGDPSASLLEILDHEQNRHFADNYVSLPFDLGEVFFITTANSIDRIPAGLIDRLEIIEFPGYTTLEKVTIAERHLIPKQLRAHGLAAGALGIGRPAIRRITDEFAQEAGLRDLERCIAAICRKRAVSWLGGERKKVVVAAKDLGHYLGTPRYYPEAKSRRPEIGLATALAWTPSGGQILFIEATSMPGRQSLQITGQLGDVMRESAETALSFVRSFLDRRGAPPDILEGQDIHIHVPAGAISKDGPSAGIAIAVALYSLISGQPARHDVALTGEITLRGHVLPVGGVKQKILGAYRCGIRHVVLPARNEPELADVPDEVKKKLHIIPIERVEEAFLLACLPPKGGR